MAINLQSVSMHGSITMQKLNTIPTDSYFSNVVLLAHFDGTNNSTSFTDSSASPKTLTAAGTSKLTTSSFKFGTASLSLSGSDVSVSTSNDYAFGSGNFTIEAWINVGASATGGIWSNYLESSGVGTVVALNNGKLMARIGNDGGGGSALDDITAATNIPINQWIHVAYVRNGNTLTLYQNGTSVGTVSTTRSVTNTAGNIGRYYTSVDNFKLTGLIDELRITKGVARYTTNFTTPSAAFPNS